MLSEIERWFHDSSKQTDLAGGRATETGKDMQRKTRSEQKQREIEGER